MPDSNGHLVAPSSFKRYNPDRGLWTSFDAGHMVNVTGTNATILLKRGSVVDCVDLDTHLNQIRTGPHSNLFTNLAAERKAVKASLHSRNQSQEQHHSNRSIIQSQPLQERRRNHSIARVRSSKDTPALDPNFGTGPSEHQVRGHSPWSFGSDEDTPTPTVKRDPHRASSVISLSSTEPQQPRRAPSVISLSSTDSIVEHGHSYIPGPSHQPRPHHRALSIISLSSIEDEDTSDTKHAREEHHQASNLPSRSSSPIIEHRSQSAIDDRGKTSLNAIDLETIRVWPYDFHACDIEAGFQKCREAVHSRHKVSAAFQKYFRTKFVKSTFYDHRRYWMEVVDASVRARYIGYGHTDQGLWSAFLDNEIRNGEDV